VGLGEEGGQVEGVGFCLRSVKNWLAWWMVRGDRG
jgi:hypothetical protein